LEKKGKERLRQKPIPIQLLEGIGEVLVTLGEKKNEVKGLVSKTNHSEIRNKVKSLSRHVTPSP